jgi:hypothetical protein
LIHAAIVVTRVSANHAGAIVMKVDVSFLLLAELSTLSAAQGAPSM